MRRKRNLLVLDFDGVVLRGAVVQVDRKGTVEIRRHAASTATTPEAAVQEVAGALGRTPSACIVRSAEVVAGLVRLPIASAGGRTPDEIAQMLRWELEPLGAQQAVVPPIGAILVARRHLEHAGVERVLATMRERRASGHRDAASLRFGAVARELGLVSEEHLAEALAIQERAGRAEDDQVCGWSVQPATAEPGGGALWLAAGMPAARRRWWAAQLAAHGGKLLALYPRLPGATGALPPGANATLLEVEPYAVARSVVRDGALVSLEVLPASEAEPAEHTLRDLVEGTDPAATVLCGSLAARAAVRGVPLPLLEPPLRGAVDGPAAAWAGIVGAARHAAGHGGPAVAVPARDPGTPLLRRTSSRWAATLLLVAAAAVGMDRLAHRQLLRSVRELAAARERLDKVAGGIRAVEERSADAGRLAQEIATLAETRDALHARLRMLGEVADTRARFLPEILDALAGAVNDEIMLDSTTEQSPGRVRVEGRALSEHAVQAFGRAVAARILPLRLRVAEQAIRRASSRDSRYSFSFLLEPIPAEDL